MSGKPYPEGVAEFKEAWTAMSNAALRANVLAIEVAARNKEIAELNEVYASNKKKLFTLMKDMDIASDGNFGYEGRMTWFLVELHKQFSEIE